MSDMDWLAGRTLFAGVSGSHAYGTSLPESDVDVRGVAVAPMRCYLGVTVPFEQADALPPGYWQALSPAPSPVADLARTSTDAQIMDVRKFLRLAADCNPNVIELLFLPDEALAHVHPAWRWIAGARDACLSRRARFTFAGYASSQLKRIQTHRRWLLDPPKAKPSRQDFGLSDRLPIPKDQLDAARSLVEKRIQSWTTHPDVEIPETMLVRIREAMVDLTLAVRPDQDPSSTQHLAAGASLGIDSNFMDVLERERRYRQSLAWFNQYEQWKAQRNPARAEMEARCGYDVKHGTHLIRLLRMACEILDGQGVIVRRPDADELRSIRRGDWPYERVLQESERLDAEAGRLYATTDLPQAADRDTLDIACMTAIMEMEAGDGGRDARA